MQLELPFIKIDDICIIPNGWMEQDLTQFAVMILCYDSTYCDEMRYHFATEADSMIDIVCEVDLDTDWF